MNTIKSLLAVSVLAIAGAANAATVATFNVAVSGTINVPGQATGTISGTGTAVLDDSGFLTMNNSATTNMILFGSVPAVATIGTTSTFSGTLTGNSLAWTAGTSTSLSCTPGMNGGLICPNVPLNTPAAAHMDENPMVFSFAIGGITVLNDTSGAQGPVSYTLTTLTAPAAVPVPAAAWLFGSGMLGLAGTARRRRHHAA